MISGRPVDEVGAVDAVRPRAPSPGDEQEAGLVGSQRPHRRGESCASAARHAATQTARHAVGRWSRTQFLDRQAPKHAPSSQHATAGAGQRAGHVVESAYDAAGPPRRARDAGAAVRRRPGSTSWACRSSPASTRSPTSWCSSLPDGWARRRSPRSSSAPAVARSSLHRCTEAALLDQPTRYVQAARAILDQPSRFPEVAARLFDAEAERAPGARARTSMEMTVGDVAVQVRPDGAVHRHRARPRRRHRRPRQRRAARSRATGRRPSAGRRRCRPRRYVVGGHSVSALVDGDGVGRGRAGRRRRAGRAALDLQVDPAWRRRGIGTRLLLDAARLAHALGADEIVLTTRADNQAVLPMVLAAGLRGRIRMAGDTLTVRVRVRDLEPLRVWRRARRMAEWRSPRSSPPWASPTTTSCCCPATPTSRRPTSTPPPG